MRSLIYATKAVAAEAGLDFDGLPPAGIIACLVIAIEREIKALEEFKAELLKLDDLSGDEEPDPLLPPLLQSSLILVDSGEGLTEFF